MGSVLEEIEEYCLARNFFMWEHTKFMGKPLAFKETFEEFKLIMDIWKLEQMLKARKIKVLMEFILNWGVQKLKKFNAKASEGWFTVNGSGKFVIKAGILISKKDIVPLISFSHVNLILGCLLLTYCRNR